MKLSKTVIKTLAENSIPGIPNADIFSLPEKVLQFGTGVLLRGLPDYYIDKANKQGIFNGRIVVVKSTSKGDTNDFAAQDNLYTHCIRAIAGGKKIEENIVNASVSRVLSASDGWDEVLKCAEHPSIQIIISNTTEVGIVMPEQEDINAAPPHSFPGKLLAFLYKRYKVFGGSDASGMVIVPTELITENGSKLKAILTDLSKRYELEEKFIEWLSTSNDFCNSLVDRIVPGKLPDIEKKAIEDNLGYTDELMLMSEAYSLWAIETSNKRTIEILSFSKADPGVVIAEDINIYKELKLRLLNGSHTFSCALALQLGFISVKEAMNDLHFHSFINRLMMDEIAPAITSEKLPLQTAKDFAAKVLDRYRNPFIEHQWQSISLQYTTKMKMRNIPVLLAHYKKSDKVPEMMALGFAAYLLLMNVDKNADRNYIANTINGQFVVNDDKASRFYELWRMADSGNFVKSALSDEDLWGTDLSLLPGFEAAIRKNLISLQSPETVSLLL